MRGKPPAGGDQVLPATRWTFLVFAVILVSAVIILWGTPGHTDDRWAWTIRPDMTPVFMGSVYAAGAYVFVRLFLSEVWHPYNAVLIGAIVLTALLLITTLIHLDRFHHGDGPLPSDIAFYGWVGIYAGAPFWISYLWWRNRGADRGPVPGEASVSEWARRAALAGGAIAVAASTVMFLWPDGAIDIWPWELTPLTARVLASYVATIGVLGLVLARDPRWSSWRVIVQTLFVFTLILLVGSLKELGDFDKDDPLTTVYFAGIVGALGGLTGFAIKTRPQAAATSADRAR